MNYCHETHQSTTTSVSRKTTLLLLRHITTYKKPLRKRGGAIRYSSLVFVKLLCQELNLSLYCLLTTVVVSNLNRYCNDYILNEW